jgi:hypothetical protein
MLERPSVRRLWDHAWVRALPGLAALLCCQLVFVPPTNFGGVDEWLELEVTSRSVVSVPYAYRPLGLIWPLPASLAAPLLGFASFRVFFAIYALLSAVLVFTIVRRLGPRVPLLATLTACFVVAWAPHDQARLSTVESAVYQGITLGLLLAAALMVEGWARRNFTLLSLSVLAAFLSVRCYEGSFAPLAAVPALLLMTQERSRRLWTWGIVWWSTIGIALAFYILEMQVSLRENSYQLSVLGLHADAAGWAARMVRQYSYHVLPLITSPPLELATAAVPIAVLMFVVTLALLGETLATEARERPRLALSGLVGLGLAGLGYSLVLVGVAIPTAFRLQMMSGPGIALFFAATMLGLSSMLKGHGRSLAVVLMGSWVVAVGTGRTVAMQAEWQRHSSWPRQAGMLSALLRAVPDVMPHTLLLVLDDAGAWTASFSFHHAVQYLYERRAAGFVLNREDRIYTLLPTPEGIEFEPWAILRRAWSAPKTVYGYHELVVLRETGTGQVVLLESWPSELSALPAGATYAPRSRIVSGPPVSRSAVLARYH